ncbi:Oidioi.mRNA.OKI2018_I69.chr1.g112.t1.cds [Oikopleura dioica]|uniref:Dynein axonemal intermediate chain 4 n=1 Tax=Oikopleura dioica TaxID=34765 RepID=A0ABN7SML2_OIKDI|nr:Oidioi.mRNA.OKI2018_I69.chr1.g112.t1.cds [Oikopleura dioica]
MTSVKLVETETIFYFRHEGDVANDEVENIELIGEVNHAYEKLLKSKEGNEDKFMERGMQTFNPMMKPLPGVRASTEIKQKIQTDKITFAEAGSQVSDYLLENINESSSENPTPLLSSPDRINEEDLTKSSGKVGSMMMSTASASMASSKSAVISTRNKAAKIEQEKNFKNILSSSQFSNSLKLVERVLSQNIHNAQVGTFRNSSALDIMGENWSLPNEVGFHTLWEYSCAETSGLVVNHVTWHPTDPDLIAVAYGFLDEEDQSRSRGLVACWTIANLEHPTRLFSFNSPVCKVSFAELQNYLAVGLYSGEISVINIKAKDSMLNTVDSQGKHMGPVWGLQWIKRERGGDEKQEVLVSAAGDGRVVQWTIRKGLEFLDLMKVKRSQPKTRKTREKKSSNTKISHFSPNTALAFSPKNDQTYLVGTEEGLIHRCSCAYNEQTLDTYKGHGGPIYSIEWHPTVDRLFASASEDWSIRIWDQKHENPLAILLTAGQRPVFDICWSPYAQTKLLSVNDRTLEIWDYSKSILDPISSTTLNSPSKSINFAPHSDSIFLGDSDGKVFVKKTVGIRSAEDAEKVFLELVQNTFKSQKDVSK